MRLQSPAWLVAGLALLLSAGGVVGQGFVNLDFESPILPLNPVNFQVQITNSLPGWTGYIGNSQVNRVVYDTVSLGAAAISFQDSSGFISLQGQYCVGLQSTDPGNQFMAALAQIGRVPQDALSVRFFASDFATLELSFAGQVIPLFQIGSGNGYGILGGDISSFAGQTGELRFTSGMGPLGHGGGGFLDSIQFSNQPIPEPGVFALSTLGGLLLGWRVVDRRR